jgi:hypothetical protein
VSKHHRFLPLILIRVDNSRLTDCCQRIAVTRSAAGYKIRQASRLTKIGTSGQITRSYQPAELLHPSRSSWWPLSDRLFAFRDILSVLSGCHLCVRLRSLCSFLLSGLPLFVRLRGFCSLLIRSLHLGLLTVLIAVRGVFVTATELEVWGSVIAVSASAWRSGQ